MDVRPYTSSALDNCLSISISFYSMPISHANCEPIATIVLKPMENPGSASRIRFFPWMQRRAAPLPRSTLDHVASHILNLFKVATLPYGPCSVHVHARRTNGTWAQLTQFELSAPLKDYSDTITKCEGATPLCLLPSVMGSPFQLRTCLISHPLKLC
jgi:hypothetical protein